MYNNQTFKNLIDNYFDLNKLSQSFLIKSFKQEEINDELIYFLNKINLWNITDLNKFQSPDLMILDISDDKVTKEELENVIYKMSLSPLEFEYKVLIIKNIENLSLAFNNSLLKIVEESFSRNIIILTTNNINKVLPTIKSRCQILNINNKEIKNNTELTTKQFSILKKLNYSESKNLKISKEFLNILENINLYLKKAIKSPYAFKSFLSKDINIDNVELYLILLKSLIIDIMSQNYHRDFFYDKNIFKKLTNKNIDYLKILEAIQQFWNKINTNNNFNLLKEVFLITITEAYDRK